MLRPATPLTLLLFASFVLLLLSVLSTPVVKGIPLAEFREVNFGVFGFCAGDECTGPTLGYTTDKVFDEGDKDGDFSLPANARHSLSSLLIVHPIAALFNLVCLGLAGAAHLHSPSHSARYLLGLLIFLLPTLLVTLLAFLVDVLLFVPHMKWGGWIVLASTVLITASGVVTCAMRRTLVSRKARKKRIAENAEMSGENFYNRQNSFQKSELVSPADSAQPTMPVVNGTSGSDSVPILSTFNKEAESFQAGRNPDYRSPSTRNDSGPMGSGGRYGGSHGSVRSRSQDHRRSPPHGSDIPLPSDGSRVVLSTFDRGPSDASLRHNSSRERMNGQPPVMRGGSVFRGSRGRGGYPPSANYGPPRHDFGGPRGGMNATYGNATYGGAGYSDRGRDSYNTGGRGGHLPPSLSSGVAPRSHINNSAQSLHQAPLQGFTQPARQISRERMGPAGSIRQYPSMGEMRPQSAGSPTRPPQPHDTPPLPQSGPIVGQALDMGAVPGSSHEMGAMYGTGESQPSFPPAVGSALGPEGVHGSTRVVPANDSSVHGGTSSPGPDGYIPPRTRWNGDGRNESPNFSRPVVFASDPSATSSSSKPASRPRAASSVYYEDVDPRFTERNDGPSAPHPPASHPTIHSPPPVHGGHSAPQSRNIPPTSSAEFLPLPDADGTRSPTGSDISQFTSVSQRGVNPNWKPSGEEMRSMPRPEAAQRGQHPGVETGGGSRHRDMLLQSNPDFAVPGMGPPGRGVVHRGEQGGLSGGPTRIGPPSDPIAVNGLNGAGRYPPP